MSGCISTTPSLDIFLKQHVFYSLTSYMVYTCMYPLWSFVCGGSGDRGKRIQVVNLVRAHVRDVIG